VSLEEAFAKLAGRHASETERERLYRLRDALGMRDNDAFWSIVLALEHYDSFFHASPVYLSAGTRWQHAPAAWTASARRPSSS
jgi:hypothetical protein